MAPLGGIGRRPPYGIQRPTGPQVDARQEVAAGLDELDRNAPARGLGMPTESIHYEAEVSCNYGDEVNLDPTERVAADSIGVYQYARLPKGDRYKIGEVVTVKNYSSSTRKIRIAPVNPPDTIDKAAYKEIETAWAIATVKLISDHEWICSAQNGCVDCSSTCSGTCTGSCASACAGGCTTACGGSCTAACGASCTGGCSGSCATGCTGDCSATCTLGCQSTCSATCTGDCTGACVLSCAISCAYNCIGSCAGDCTETCGGNCTGGCTVSCSVGCSDACTGSCSGSCTGSCSGGCEGSCNRLCTGVGEAQSKAIPMHPCWFPSIPSSPSIQVGI